MHKVEIYTTANCHFCHMAKEFFKENNIEFTDHDVGIDVEKRREMLEKSGQMGVPVIIISDSSNPSAQANLIIGFNKPVLAKLLEIPA